MQRPAGRRQGMPWRETERLLLLGLARQQDVRTPVGRTRVQRCRLGWSAGPAQGWCLPSESQSRPGRHRVVRWSLGPSSRSRRVPAGSPQRLSPIAQAPSGTAPSAGSPPTWQPTGSAASSTEPPIRRAKWTHCDRPALTSFRLVPSAHASHAESASRAWAVSSTGTFSMGSTMRSSQGYRFTRTPARLATQSANGSWTRPTWPTPVRRPPGRPRVRLPIPGRRGAGSRPPGQ